MSIKKIKIWKLQFPIEYFNEFELNYLNNLPKDLPTVQWIWKEMDRIWDSLSLDNSKSLTEQQAACFYSHPVWIANGIFTACDPDSKTHRQSIAKYIITKRVKNIADYGGGFGEFALELNSQTPEIQIDIIEPFPSFAGQSRIKDKKKITLKKELGRRLYDAIVVQDILEHVDDPIGLSIALSKSLKRNGIIIYANCFHPFIKCHLPQTFYLRFTFKYVMVALGLQYFGFIPQAKHALIFKKNNGLFPTSARRVETLSKIIGPILNSLGSIISKIKGI